MWRIANVFLLLLALVWGDTSPDAITTCKLVFEDWEYDLSPLTKVGGSNWYSEDGFFHFSWNYCSTVLGNKCPTSPAFMEIGTAPCIGFGNLEQTGEIGVMDPFNPQKGIYLSYWGNQECSPGQRLGILINNWCDAGVSEAQIYAVKVYDGTDCLSVIDVKSKHGCPYKKSSGGLSIGSILLITLTVLVFVYVVGGMVYRYRFKQATGLDMVPNRELWFTNIPNLVKDGCVFSYIKIRGRISGQPAESYTML